MLIHDVRTFTGTTVLERSWVLIRDGLIAEVTAEPLDVPDDVERIDGRGLTLLPGLIDAHAHVFPGSLAQAARFGVTTVLDLMADPHMIATQRKLAGTTTAVSDVLSAGTAATVPDGYGWYLVEMGYLPPFPTLTAPAQAEAFVADRVAEGSDYIKIMIDDGSTTGMPLPKLRADTVAALIDTAHAHDRLAIAHALNGADAELAANSGIDILAHLFVDRPAEPGLLELLAANDIAVTPTLAVLDGLFGSPHGADLLADERVAPYLDEASRQMLGFGTIPLGPNAHYDLDVPATTVALLREAGVTILAGSDASNTDTAHGVTLHLELALLVRAGLTPIEALTAATSAPANRYRLSDRGNIAPGLRADLLLVNGDPTHDITATLDIAAIWRGGRRIDRTVSPEAQNTHPS